MIRLPVWGVALGFALTLTSPTAHAATGTWTVDGGGLWSNGANWSGGVPGAAGDTASLAYPITAARTITNDVVRALGILNLADSLASGYTLTNNSGITLTLNNRGAGAQINQTGGAAASDLIATPIKLADNLFLNNNSQLTFSGVISGTGFGLTKAGSGIVTSTAADAFTGAVVVNGGTLLFGPGGAINGAASLAINNGGTVQFSGAANGNPIGAGNMPITVNAGATLAITVGNAMGYSAQANYAGLTVNGGTLSLSAVQYINTLLLNGGTVSGTGALQFWYPVSGAINCSRNANIFTPINFNNSAQTIAVAGGATLSVSGAINTSGFTKTGAGTLALAGANTYTGTTTVSNGILQVDGSLAGGAMTVMSGGSLTGVGTINGPVMVQAGGTLAPGDAGIGTLTINNSLTLAGSTVVASDKSGTTLRCAQVAGLQTVTYGGALVVTNSSDPRAPALQAGDTFLVFSATNYQGAFASQTLPALPAGLIWDSGNLNVNGSLTVVASSGPPIIVSQPLSQSVNAGASVFFQSVAAGSRPLACQWQKNGANIATANSTSCVIASASTNDAAGYSLVVTNAYGSVTSSVAVLTLNPPPPATSVTNGLVVHLSFDNTLAGQAGTAVNGALYTGGATNGPRYTAGVIGSAATFANTSNSGQPADWAVTLGNLESVYANSFSVSFWERSRNGADGALMGNKNWSSGANVGWVISVMDGENLNWNTAGGTRSDLELNPPFMDGNWHLVTVTFDRTAGAVTSYIDGAAAVAGSLNPASTASLNAGLNTLVGGSGNGAYSGAGDVDDLGVWTRVLTPQEVAAIYAAGLIGKPLNAAVPGQLPVITNQPASLSVSSGGTATLSVAATGPGNFSYQWQLNGVAIPGATNATLVLPGVNAASQGIYTVLVSDAFGAVASHDAVLTVYTRMVTGQWDFSHGDLRATVGADLQYVGDTTNRTSFPVVSINGVSAPVMAFAGNSPSEGFCLWPGAMPNGAGQFVNQYTLIMDLLIPASSYGQPLALLQTDPFNHPGTDAEFYVGDNAAGPAPDGIGIAGGQFNGTLQSDTWYRLAFAVDLTAPAGQQLTTYTNGVPVGCQSLPGGVDGQYALGPAAQLFTSGLGGKTQAGFVSSIQFVNGCLPPADLAALGGPSAAKLPPGNAVLQITNLSLNASQLTLKWQGPGSQFQVQHTSNLGVSAWQSLGTLNSNTSLTTTATGAKDFYRVTQTQPDIQVGPLPGGEQSLPSKQILRAAGSQLQFSGRPVDLALSPDAKTVYIKNLSSLLVVDAASWTLRQTLSYPSDGASLHGIAVNPAGTHVYVTGSGNELYDWQVTNGTVAFSRTIALGSGSDPCGLAISGDGSTAYVCLSIANQLAVVNLASGSVSKYINVGIAPWEVVLSPNGTNAWVSDWGGRFPTNGDLTATSAGTSVVIDSRGIAASGVVSVVNLATGLETAEVATDLHPSDMALSQDGGTLYVANANSDTVTVIDTHARAVKETILVRPSSSLPFGNSSALPFGSESDGLALGANGTNLFVACAGNNAIAVIALPAGEQTNSVVQGFMPTDWYPGAVVTDGTCLYSANVKGLGSRSGQPAATSFTSTSFLGTANRIPIPSADALSKDTAVVIANGRLSQIQQARQVPLSGRPPVPVPARAGEPSVFQHVLYILKENKTYDQVFGDLPRGNGNSSLCIYPQNVTPNHHALAQQYVLLDNFYCNGVNSADGHSWCSEGNNSDHLEKSFGGFVRSYTFGDDPLTYSSSGFIWNNALQHGLTFRNYGEFDYASVNGGYSWAQIYTDYTNGTHAITYSQNIGVASLRPYSSTNVPGWNLNIPDQVRAYGFIQELNAAQTRGNWAALHLLYLPDDHTGGTPPAQAQVADNDLALGKVVQAVTTSLFASNTVIFVIEDDPQSGYDHVDGHRSLCLVISPYTKRGQTVSVFYNQTGVLHTMEQILGLPPMNQQDAMAPLMFECFTNTPDFTPYAAVANQIDLAAGGAPLSSKARYYAGKVRKMDFSKPDQVNEDVFNRYLWHAIKGDLPYPSEFVGGHGKGLKQLGLVLVKSGRVDDD